MFWDFTFVSYSDIEPNIIFFFLRSLIIELLPLYIIFFEGHSIVYNCYNFFFQPTASKDVDLRAVKVPPIIYAERPFMVNLGVHFFLSILDYCCLESHLKGDGAVTFHA